jgi:hypothetical protein
MQSNHQNIDANVNICAGRLRLEGEIPAARKLAACILRRRS